MWRALTAVALGGALLAAGCGGDDDTATTTAGEPVQAVARVGSTEISSAELDRLIARGWEAVAGQVGRPDGAPLPDPPDFDGCVTALREEGDAQAGEEELRARCRQQYDQVRDRALTELITAEWARQAAGELDLRLTDEELRRAVDRHVRGRFAGDEDFRSWMAFEGLSERDVEEAVETAELSSRLQQHAIAAQADVRPVEIRRAYRRHAERYRVATTRIAYTLTVEDRPTAERAKRDLQDGGDWREVVARYDPGAGPITTYTGDGQATDALARAVHNAPTGRLVGPVRTDAGWTLVEVAEVTPAHRVPLAEARQSIMVELLSPAERAAVAAELRRIEGPLEARTWCRAGYEVDKCGAAGP